jgi:hypothetical protein
MTFKDLWELLKATRNAWSTHKAPQSGATLAYDTPGLLTRCAVLRGALPRAERHRVGRWPGRFARAPIGMGVLRLARVLVWRGICCSLRPNPRLPYYQETAHRFRRW